MNILKNIVISIISTLLVLFMLYNYVPISVLQKFEVIRNHFGATITVIQGSDRLSDSRAVINTNFANLNSDKFELTDWFATSSAPQLTTLGTIGTGVWEGTPVGEVFGGTGLSSYAAGDIIFAGTINTLTTLTASSTGEVLTLSSGGLPIWSDSTVNQTANFNWTGLHTFNATTTMSTTTVDSFSITGILSSLLKTDANGLVETAVGGVDYQQQKYVLVDSTDLLTTDGNFATSSNSITIPANTLNASSTINITYTQTNCTETSAGGQSCTIKVRTSAGQDLMTGTVGSDSNSSDTSGVHGDVVIGSNGSETFSSQIYVGGGYQGDGATGAAGSILNIEGTSSVDFTSDVTLQMVITTSADNFTLGNYSIVVNP